MKYLVSLEGKIPTVFNNERAVRKYIEQTALEMKKRGVKEVDEWISDLISNNYSQRYTPYPEFILAFDEIIYQNMKIL
jgi:hypothetical protein